MPAIVPGRHEGKIAIITGAGQGIGRGLAHRFAQEGAHVVIAEFNRENAQAAADECTAFGCEALAYPIDITNLDQIKQMVKDVVAKFGRIDILVNNAGVNKTQWMFDVSPQDYDRVHNVNQRALYFTIQAVGQQMIDQVPQDVKDAGRAERSYGKIVNFSSISGRHGRPYASDYAATKFAVIGITQSAALALAPYNINVNAVCPGIVWTPMWEDIDRTQSARFGMEQGQWRDSFVEKVPLKRPAQPEDIAAVVSFLCSTDADYVTGQAINVDGGFEMN